MVGGEGGVLDSPRGFGGLLCRARVGLRMYDRFVATIHSRRVAVAGEKYPSITEMDHNDGTLGRMLAKPLKLPGFPSETIHKLNKHGKPCTPCVDFTDEEWTNILKLESDGSKCDGPQGDDLK